MGHVGQPFALKDSGCVQSDRGGIRPSIKNRRQFNELEHTLRETSDISEF